MVPLKRELRREFLEQDAAVRTAETEGVRERVLRIKLLGTVGHAVEVAFRIGRLIVDRAGNIAGMQGKHGEHGLHAAGGPKRWPVWDLVAEMAIW